MNKRIYLFMALMLIFGLFNITGSFAQSCTCEGHGYGYAGDCCHPSTGSACGNCGTIDCGGSCVNQGVCSPGSTQCSNGRYQTCSGSCGWANSGTDADNDGTDAQCGDSLCDNSPGVFDSTKQSTETSCTDILDNDCNTDTDCQDAQCSSTLQGTVTDTSNNSSLPDSKVDVKDQNLNILATAFTDYLGNYQATTLCGTHNLAASKEDYVTGTKANVEIPPQTTVTEDFGLVFGQICEADCTYTGDNIVHKGCGQINGCAFYDATAAQACDLAQPGWIRNYNETHIVQCAPGIPQEEIKVEATVTCEEENLVKSSQIVNFQGKLVSMVVVICG